MSIQLAPEIEARLRDEARARGVTIDDLVSAALTTYGRPSNGAPPDVRRGPYTQRTAEMAWLSRPDPQFIGKWVVLQGDRGLASGSTAKAVHEEAKSQGVEVPFVVYVSPHRNEPFAGGWLD